MSGDHKDDAHEGNELGTALRRWRDRIDPVTHGLPTGGVRRTAGLRRQELAQLAGISVDYVVRLEQGRAASPSTQVLTALARALRLSAQERGHLFRLAGRLAPTSGRISTHLTPSVRRLLDRMEGPPVGVYDAAWTLVAYNRPYVALLGHPSGLATRERNVLWCHFTGVPGRVTHSVEQRRRFEVAVVADLRAAAARYPHDTGLGALVADLRSISTRFAELWSSREVGRHAMDTKMVYHPDVGRVALDCDVLTDPDGDLRVVVHTAAPGTDAADKLSLLGVLDSSSVPEPCGPGRQREG